MNNDRTFPAIYEATTRSGGRVTHTVMARGATMEAAFLALDEKLRTSYGMSEIAIRPAARLTPGESAEIAVGEELTIRHSFTPHKPSGTPGF